MNEITGRLIEKFNESGQKKDGGTWNKTTIVLKYGKKDFDIVALDTLNSDCIQFANDTDVGSLIKCKFSVRSRKYKDKYYTSAGFWSPEIVKDYSSPQKTEKIQVFEGVSGGAGESDDLPF